MADRWPNALRPEPTMFPDEARPGHKTRRDAFMP